MTQARILIVDDSRMMRRGLRKYLSPLRAELTEAVDGQEGFELATKCRFDLVITDIDMPRMNGIQLCERLKTTPATRGTPVIMLSSFDSDADIDRGFQAGASAYVTKDEARSCLLETIDDILPKAAFRRNRLILVVDDSSIIRRMVENGLAQAGFQVITAENGRKALQFLQTRRPDFILSDIDMPEMNGFAFCEAVHANPDLATIPFVVMSANSDRSHMLRMLRRGATAYITKPFNLDQLVILVEKLLSDQFQLLLKEKERLDADRKMLLASITSLALALEARDAYTRGHSEAVATILSGMAMLMGASNPEIEALTIGGKLHDIGKIGTRDSILQKPGRLTDEEFTIIKQHPTIGATILKSIPSLSDIITIVLHHHERFDGKGYPEGLSGQKISQWARMAAVADTYHALTSDRPYRKGLPCDQALQVLEDVQGSQLCPDCVALFFKWISTQENTGYLVPQNLIDQGTVSVG
ncbi:MAG: response regulator [Deltaproteobacteria bacterium]|nr:response regulator [Deltaproteobacteria bacterium]